MVDLLPKPTDGRRDPAIAIAALVVGKDRLDALLERAVLVGQRLRCLLIVKCAPGKPCQLEKPGDRIMWP